MIGDSYASGEIRKNNAYHDQYHLSWGQVIARRNGVHCTNYSKGGLTTRSWLTDAKGLPLLQSSDPDDLHIIALGINDAEKLGTAYLGDLADITDDPTGNPDTFCGNMGRILGAITTKNPDAKIILMTMAATNGAKPAYNTMIQQIGEQMGLPVIVQTDDEFFTSDFYRNTMSWGHPIAVTYSGMALAIERLYSKCAIKYVNYFKDYIGQEES